MWGQNLSEATEEGKRINWTGQGVVSGEPIERPAGTLVQFNSFCTALKTTRKKQFALREPFSIPCETAGQGQPNRKKPLSCV